MKYLQKIFVASLLVIGITFASVPLLSHSASALVDPKEQACKGTGGTWDAAAGTCGSNAATDDFQTVIGVIINTILFILGAVAVLMIIIGGIQYTTSAGDPALAKRGRDTVLYAVIGLVIAFLAYAIINWVVGAFNPKPATPAGTTTTP